MDIGALADEAIEVALHPDGWSSYLRSVAEAFGAEHTFIHAVTPAALTTLMAKGSGGLVEDYAQGAWHEHNQRMPRGLALTRRHGPRLLTEYDLFTPDELRKLPYEQEFARAQRAQCTMGGVLANTHGTTLVLTVERDSSRGPFVGGELEAANAFFDRLSRLMKYTLKAQIDATRNILDSYGAAGQAHAWIDADGRLVHATAAFESLIGEVLRLKLGRIVASDPSADRLLQWLLTIAGKPGPIQDDSLIAVPLGSTTHGAAIARVFPVRGKTRDLVGINGALMSVEVGRKRLETASDLLRKFYGLTLAETKLAQHLGEGDTLRNAAAIEKITYETARTRLKSIFQKTGTTRQVELALLLSRLG